MLAWSTSTGDARWALTDRWGGVSAGSYAELDLADHVGDDPGAVRENRHRVAAEIGVEPSSLLFARQVHGSAVEVVRAPWRGPPPEADALVTDVPGLALAVLVADCSPVLLAAPEEGLVAVAHAGRRGLAGGVLDRVVEVLRGLGARRLSAAVGPSICARCYAVPLALREEVAAFVPQARAVDRHGHPALDVAGGVVAQLSGLGCTVARLPGCTAESPELYSYRRDGGATGRFAGLAWLAPERP